MGDRRHTIADYQAEASRWSAAGQPDRAAQLYARVLELEPGNSRTRMQLAACLVDCGQPASAAAEYITIAHNYAAQGRGPEAIAIGHQILRLEPGCFRHAALAEVLRGVGREAGPLSRQAARAHYAAGRDDEAALLLQLCAELDPDDADAWCELAQLYLNHEMSTEAAEALRVGGRRLLSAGNNGRYLEFARAILTMEPEDLETLRELPRALLRTGEPQRAVVELSALLRVNPGDVVGYETLAQAFAVIGRTSVSLSVLKQLIASLCSSGRKEEAEALLERARGWRDDDLEFGYSVVELQLSQPASPASAEDPELTTEQGTVVLSIADLTQHAMQAEAAEVEDEVFDATELVELVDGEDSVVLRLSDLSRVEPLPSAPQDTPSPRPAEASTPRDPQPQRCGEASVELASGAQGPASEDTQSLRYGQTPPPPEETQSLDLRDIIEMHEDAISSRGETIVGVPRPPRIGLEDEGARPSPGPRG